MGSYKDDMAIITLQHVVNITDGISPICLPTAAQYFSESSVCFVTGWGIKHAKSKYPIFIINTHTTYEY